MRNIIKTTIIILLMIAASCSKDSDSTKLRVENTSGLFYLYDIQVGPLNFGRINAREKSSYMTIDEGRHNISWRWEASGLKMDDRISISGPGKYTLKLNEFSANLYKN